MDVAVLIAQTHDEAALYKFFSSVHATIRQFTSALLAPIRATKPLTPPPAPA